jgi:choline kinase
MSTVLITTSGTGSRLGQRTAHTNKSLLKIGDMYAICHIVNLYPPTSEFVVTLGYYGNHVQQFLQMAYPTYKFTFVNVDLYEGEGSSLGYSMLKARPYLQKPFIFHCCDTLVDTIKVNQKANCVYVYPSVNYETYASIQVDGTLVKSMNGKGVTPYDYLYIGISHIQNFDLFWNELESLYNRDPLSSGLSDIHAIQRMILQGIPFEYEVISSWYDTGNIKSLQEAQAVYKSQHPVLEKYDESLCFLADRVIKFFSDSSICKKRCERGYRLYPIAPAILDASSNFFCMEYVKGVPLGSSRTTGDVRALLEWSFEHLWGVRDTNEKYRENCLNFYKKKTYERISKIPFLSVERCKVNGLFTGSCHELLKRVDFESLSTDTFTHYHGDFILDNLMKCQGISFKLLDWRQDFDGNLEFGDMYYDLAKLRHNIYFNHANIVENLFYVKEYESEVYVDMKCNFLLINQEKELQSFCKEKNLNYRKIKVLTSIIWLNMAPLYEGDLSKFLYYLGKYTLAEELNTPITIL